MTAGTPHDQGAPRAQYGFFGTQVAPLSPRRALSVYGLLALPAIAGAVLDWSWMVQSALMLPAMILSVRWGKAQARLDGAAPRNPKRDAWIGALLGGCLGVVLSLVGGYDGNGRYLGLVVVAFGVVFDQVARWQYRRYRRVEG